MESKIMLDFDFWLENLYRIGTVGMYPERPGNLGQYHTLNFRLNIVDGIWRLHLKGDSLTRKGLDEDLHFNEGL